MVYILSFASCFVFISVSRKTKDITFFSPVKFEAEHVVDFVGTEICFWGSSTAAVIMFQILFNTKKALKSGSKKIRIFGSWCQLF